MRVLAVDESGRPLTTFELGHGWDPRAALAERSLELLRPVRAYRESDGELAVLVEAAPGRSSRSVRVPIENPTGAPRRQRVAAYAIVVSARGVLGTEFSGRTGVPGQWGLPGGGIDPGEEPEQTVLRELVEESGQVVRLGELIDVQSQHWVGTSPLRQIEDFHALRLIYAADCDDPTEPVVHDVGGTTSAAAWVPLERWREWPWTAGGRSLLERHLPAAAP